MAMVSTVVLVAMPGLQRLVHRSKIEGIVRQTATLMSRARHEAINRGVPAVVFLDDSAREVVGFIDLHGAALTDPSDLKFNPIDAAADRTTDYELFRLPLPGGVSFTAPAPHTAVDDFTDLPDEVWNGAVFDLDGSVRDEGAFRIADERENFLEIRIEFAATAKVVIRKWNEDETEWLAKGDKGEVWEWK